MDAELVSFKHDLYILLVKLGKVKFLVKCEPFL